MAIIVLLTVLLLNCSAACNLRSVSTTGAAVSGSPESGNTENAVSANPANRTNFGLKGNVKQWIRQSYRITEASGKIVKVLLKKEAYTFNQVGQQTGVKGYKDEEGVLSQSFYTYNKTGNIVEERHYAEEGVLLVKVDYTYDSAGKMTGECKADLTTNQVYTTLWEYDNSGKLLSYRKAVTENNSEHWVTKITIAYGQNGNPAGEEQTQYKMDGSVHFRKITRYNSAGKKTEISEYDGNNEILKKETFKYDKAGNLTRWVESTTHFETKKAIKIITTWKYDKSGKLLESREPGQVLNYQYDKKGNITAVIESGEAGKPVRKTITLYDERNLKKEEQIINYRNDGKAENRYVYTFKDAAKPVAWAKYDGRGKLLYKHQTIYDANGNKTEEVADGTAELPRIKYEYEYDEKNNLVETKCYRLEDEEKPLLVMLYEYKLTYRE